MSRTLVETFKEFFYENHDSSLCDDYVEDEGWIHSEEIEKAFEEYYNEAQIEEAIRQEIIDEENRVAKMEIQRQEYRASNNDGHVIGEL